MTRKALVGGWIVAGVAACLGAVADAAAPPQVERTVPLAQITREKCGDPDLPTRNVIYYPTPPEVVEAMLKTADVKPGDIVYDLGSGDGRIPIMAVQKFGAAKAVGIDIDPLCIKEATANAAAAGVADRVTFRNENLFETNFSEATVVTLYLLESLNEKLRPKLWSDLRPGTRIVSHAFKMGSWTPERTLDVNGRLVHFWTIPAPGAQGR